VSFQRGWVAVAAFSTSGMASCSGWFFRVLCS